MNKKNNSVNKMLDDFLPLEILEIIASMNIITAKNCYKTWKTAKLKDVFEKLYNKEVEKIENALQNICSTYTGILRNCVRIISSNYQFKENKIGTNFLFVELDTYVGYVADGNFDVGIRSRTAFRTDDILLNYSKIGFFESFDIIISQTITVTENSQIKYVSLNELMNLESNNVSFTSDRFNPKSQNLGFTLSLLEKAIEKAKIGINPDIKNKNGTLNENFQILELKLNKIKIKNNQLIPIFELKFNKPERHQLGLEKEFLLE